MVNQNIEIDNSVNSYKTHHTLIEFSTILKSISDDLESSAELFDKAKVKNETFSNLERTLTSPIEGIMHMSDVNANIIYDYIVKGFIDAFKAKEDNYNFIFLAKKSRKEVAFFISTKNNQVKKRLEEQEFEYATSDISDYMNVNFYFVPENSAGSFKNVKKVV